MKVSERENKQTVMLALKTLPLFGIVTSATTFARIIAFITISPYLALKHELSIYYLQNCDNNRHLIVEVNLQHESFLLFFLFSAPSSIQRAKGGQNQIKIRIGEKNSDSSDPLAMYEGQ